MSKKIDLETLLASVETNAAASYERWLASKTPQVAKAPKAKASGSRNLAALKAHRTMAIAKMRGASASIRKGLKAKVADYDLRISQAA